MIAALVVVVLVSAGDVESAQTGGVSRGLEEALEPGSVVLVRAAPVAPDDADLRAIAASVHADAAAVITWTEAEGRHVHVRVQRANASAAADRDLDFRSTDASVERGKTVGFAIASMLPGTRVVEPAAPAPSDKPTAAAPAEARDAGALAMSWGVDLGLAATIGIGGTAGGVGGGLALRRELGAVVSVRVAAAITRGSVSDAEGSLTVVRPRAGLGLTLLRTRSVIAGARVEIGPWLHVVDRAGGGRTSGSRWLGGVESVAEVAWTVAPRLALTFDLGLDVAFGTTRVIVGGEERASIPLLRGVGDAGVRLLF